MQDTIIITSSTPGWSHDQQVGSNLRRRDGALCTCQFHLYLCSIELSLGLVVMLFDEFARFLNEIASSFGELFLAVEETMQLIRDLLAIFR